MSVVRKYQPGGVTPDPNKYNDYADFIAKKLDEERLTSKASRDITPVAQSWTNLFKSGLVDKVYKNDPVSKTYTIDTNYLSDDLKNIDWQGSKDAINYNILGQISAKPDKSNKGEEGDLTRRKFNTLLANWTNEYLAQKNQQSSEKQPVYEPKLKIQNLKDYISKNLYGGQEGFQDLWTKDISEITDPIEKQKHIMNVTSSLFDLYNKQKGVHSGYTPVENEELIKKAIESGDWKTYLTETRKLGWNPEELLMNKTPEELKQLQEEEKNKQLKEFAEDLLEQGYSQEIVEQILTGGYTNRVENNLFEGSPDWFQQEINKNALVLSNPKGRQILIDKKGLYQPSFESPLHPGYKSYLQYEGNVPKLYSPGMEGYDTSRFADQIGGLGYASLEGKVDGFEGWQMLGLPNFNNGWSYHNTIIMNNPSTGEKVELQKTPEGYINTKTGQPVNVKIDKIAQGIADIELPNYLQFKGNNKLFEGDVFDKVKPATPTQNLETVLARTNDFISKNLDRNYLIHTKELIPALRYYLSSPSLNNYQKMQVEKAYKDLINHIKTTSNKPDDTVKNINQVLGVNTKRNYQSGGTISREEYINKYIKPTEEKPTEETKVKDIRGSLKDASPWQIASLVGAGSSFIPGVGVFGAGLTTVADIAEDISKDGFQMSDIFNLNTAANVGFMGLGLVGLGGLRALRIAGQAAKTTGKTAQLAKVVKSADDVKDLTNAINKLNNVKVGSFKNAGIVQKELDLLKKAGIVSEKANISTMVSNSIGKGVKEIIEESGKNLSKNLSKELSKTITRPNLLQREFSGTIDLVKGVNPEWKNLAKYGGMGVKGLALGTGAVFGFKVASGAAEDGLEGVQVSDLKNLLYTAGGLRGFMKTKQGVNRAKSLIAESGKPKFSIDGKVVGEAEGIVIPTLKKPKTIAGFQRGKLSDEDVKFNTEEIKKFKDQLTTKFGDKIPENIDDLLKSGNLSKIFKTLPVDEFKILEYKDLPKDVNMFKEDYNRSRAMLEGKVTSYFTPSWLKHGYLKEGGIIKAQKGTFKDFWKAMSPSKERRNANMVNSFFFGPMSGLTDAVKTFEDVAPKVYNHFNKKEYKPSFYGPESTGGPTKVITPPPPLPPPPKDEVIIDEPLPVREPLPVFPTLPSRNPNSPTNLVVPRKQLDTKTLAVRLPSGSVEKDNKLQNPFGKLKDLMGKGNVDEKTVLNTIEYLNTLRANKRINQLWGNLKYPTFSAPGKQYARVTSPYSHFYNTQADKISSMGKRLQTSTSDLNAGINTRLAAAKQASELEEKGMLADQQQIEKQLAQQQQFDREYQLMGLDVDAKNKQSRFNQDAKMIGEGVTRLAADKTALSGYLTTLSAIRDYNQQKQLDKDYYDFATKGVTQELHSDYQKLLNEEKLAKESFAKNIPGTSSDEIWEKSTFKADFDARKKQLEEKLKTYQLENQNWMLRRQMGIRSASKGMSIEERKELLRYKHDLTKREKELERVYKSIIKNNELMQKSLSRLFK